MKKIILYIFFFFVLLLPKHSLAIDEDANVEDTIPQEKVQLVLFHSKACPHCREEIKFIEDELLPKYGDLIDVKMYEIGEKKNLDIFNQYGYKYEVDLKGVPVTFIDDKIVSGFRSSRTTGEEIKDLIEEKAVERGLLTAEEVKSSDEKKMSIPLLGKIDIENFSLPLLTIIIGLLDGFNPCAMWVLLFLISLLLGMEDRKRMWLLGSLFIISSGLVYFFFMAAWLKFLMFVGMIFAVRIAIGLIATGVGGKNLWDWWKSRKADGVVCAVSGKETTKNTFEKIKDIVKRKSLWWSIVGILILGFSVNLVELACSAGFPAIFTQVLSMSGIAMWKRYLYMAMYIVFYMIDDMVIFIIAMITLKSKMLGGKYAKYANLVGGILIFILGLLLVFKPEWLMFS